MTVEYGITRTNPVISNYNFTRISYLLPEGKQYYLRLEMLPNKLKVLLPIPNELEISPKLPWEYRTESNNQEVYDAEIIDFNYGKKEKLLPLIRKVLKKRG